jgi:branched-chain amino acid transport system permease protein
VFAVVAALLAGVGLYGVLSTVVRERTAEIGVRMAIGALPGDIFKLMVSYVARLTTIGVVLGLAAAFYLTRMMTSMLVEVKPADPVTYVAMVASFFAIAAMGLNLQFGVARLFNVGCAGFFAAGAYATAILTGPRWTEGLGGFGLPVPLGLLAAPAVAALLAALVAVLVLRLSGDYLAIATFGLATVVQIAAINAVAITGGPGGLSGIPLPFRAGACLGGEVAWLAVCLALALVVYALLQRLDAAPWGRALRAVSEDADAAAAAGKNVARYRLQAFVIGSALTGLSGALYAHNAGFIGPHDFLPILTFQLYAMVIVGGTGRHLGTLAGTLVVWALWSGSGQLLAGLLPPLMQAKAGAIRVIVIACALLAMLLLRPAGLLPERVRGTAR